MKRVFRVEHQGKLQDVGLRGLAEVPEAQDVNTLATLLQALIPLAAQAVRQALEAAVTALAGPRYSRSGRPPGLARWGHEAGSVYLGDQKVPVRHPRLRDRHRHQEVPLPLYQRLQQPRAADAGLFRKILLGLSCRDYEACAEAVPPAFGLSPSSVSRRFIRASARQLETLATRRLDPYDILALVLDGKTFAEDSMVLALGVTATGEKVLLGFVQTATENERVGAAFLRELVERGLRSDRGLLCVIDGSKGLRKALQTVFGRQAVVQRCQWHKRQNVVAHLPTGQQATWTRKLQAAYECPTYAAAKAALARCERELRVRNESAANSLAEGLEETLTLHRLGVFRELGVSLKTTNCLESIHALVEQRLGKVDRWRTSDQKRRWLAAALLDLEPRLRRIKGYHSLPLLRAALAQELGQTETTGEREAA